MGVRLPSSWMESCLNTHHQVPITIFNFSAIFTSLCGLITSYCTLMTFNSNFVYFQINNPQKKEVFFSYSDVLLEAFNLNSEVQCANDRRVDSVDSFQCHSLFLFLRPTEFCREFWVFTSYLTFSHCFWKMLSYLSTFPFTSLFI